MADQFRGRLTRIVAALETAVSMGSSSPGSVAAVRDALIGDEVAPEGTDEKEVKAQQAERASTLELCLRTFLERRLSDAKQPGATVESVGIESLLDLAIALSGAGVADYNACFCLLEDMFDTLVISEAEQLWKLVEERAPALTPFLSDTPEKSTRSKLTLIRTCNELLRRLSKSKNTNFCGRILMLLSYMLPLSDRSGVNIKGVSAVSELDVDETDDAMPEAGQEGGARALTCLRTPLGAPSALPRTVHHADPAGEGAAEAGGASVDFAFYKTFWQLQQAFSKPSAVTGAAAVVEIQEYGLCGGQLPISARLGGLPHLRPERRLRSSEAASRALLEAATTKEERSSRDCLHRQARRGHRRWRGCRRCCRCSARSRAPRRRARATAAPRRRTWRRRRRRRWRRRAQRLMTRRRQWTKRGARC